MYYWRIFKKTGLLPAFLLFCNLVMAQDLHFYGLDPTFNQTGRISKRLDYNLLVFSIVDAFNQKISGVEYPATDLVLYVQPSIIYTYSPNLNFAASYTYQRNNPFNNNYVNEHLLWQQAVLALPVGRGKITNRFRFVEAFIEDRQANKYPLSTILRYQIGFNMPLQGPTLEEKEFYLSTSNEFYFSLTGKKNATYSQNITVAGVGYYMGKAGKLELGYYQDILVRNKQKDLRFLHMAQISWITKFDFFSKKKDETEK
ncbi:MAG TPA: DUF2490 domain-containing protein [Daejeonella sp.]|nr:DUF2490 domain-containing protein [Daejeonella sp.]